MAIGRFAGSNFAVSSAEVRSKVAHDKFTAVGGGIVAIIGLDLTIYGLVANRK
jgi:hypothetical protein